MAAKLSWIELRASERASERGEGGREGGNGGESVSLILCQGLDSLQLLDCTIALTGGGGERQRVLIWAGETERESTVKFWGGQNSSFDATLDRPGHSSSCWGQRGKLELRLPGPGEKVKHNKKCRRTSLPPASLWYGSDFLDNYHYRATYNTLTGHI